MSFFIRKSGGKPKSGFGEKKKRLIKRRKPQESKDSDVVAKKSKTWGGSLDEEIDSGSDLDGADPAEGYSSSEEEETAQEKKLRITKQYLAKIEQEEADKQDDKDFTSAAVSHRLQQELLEKTGKLWKQIANTYVETSPEDIRIIKGHKLPVTCLVISPDDKYIFSASKDCSIIKWCIETGKKVYTFHGGRKGTEEKHVGHTTDILSLAISSDGKYLASGDRSKQIHIWDPHTYKFIYTFRGHRGPVSGLSFRKGTHQLYSCSHDRTVKIWSLDEMAYIETLFGHTDCITAIDCLSRERAVTCGGADGSVRVWKVVEESQLVFHGHAGSIDTISLINENNMVTGADDNSIALWGLNKKKPLVTRKNAHAVLGEDGTVPPTASENWVTSVVSLQNTDLIASGSKDGCIRLWKCGSDFKSLTPLFTIPIVGFVNSLQFSSDGSTLIAGIGQEHRLGRWWRLKQAKNSIAIINLKRKTEENKIK